MTLATILAFYFLNLGWSPPLVRATQVAQQQPAAGTDAKSASTQSSGTPSQTQPPTSADSTTPTPSSNGQAPKSAGKAQPPAKRRRHHKTTIYPDCTVSPTPLHPMPGNSTDSAKSSEASLTGSTSNKNGSTDNGTANGSSAKASTKAGAAPLKPCPPPKKVVRNGGSEEPTIQLMGGTPAEQASRQRSTDELTAAAEENMKKIEGRELSPTQQEMVTQIKQFMEQSKTAVASGDPERGHDLAMKARLLSDELVKP
ncbi:MAG TPA: hypothetical protein VFF64_04155 [Candidatus Eremiobacteraceae bacterium]|nr:hypothetical protein [Candidatus Eremiobacteraceae bacterium]